MIDWGRFDPVPDAFTKRLLENMTEPEKVLWEQLEGRLSELGFPAVPQAQVGRHIVDFLIPHLSIAIEIDGPYHDEAVQRERDQWRGAALRKAWRGLHILRFTNEQVLADAGSVFEAIKVCCERRWHHIVIRRDRERGHGVEHEPEPHLVKFPTHIRDIIAGKQRVIEVGGKPRRVAPSPASTRLLTDGYVAECEAIDRMLARGE